jgi:rubrerythrin
MATPKNYKRREVEVNRRLVIKLRRGQLFRCPSCGVLHESREECDDCQGRVDVPPWAKEA